MSLFTRSLRQQRSKENEHTERDATPEDREPGAAASGDTANGTEAPEAAETRDDAERAADAKTQDSPEAREDAEAAPEAGEGTDREARDDAGTAEEAPAESATAGADKDVDDGTGNGTGNGAVTDTEPENGTATAAGPEAEAVGTTPTGSETGTETGTPGTRTVPEPTETAKTAETTETEESSRTTEAPETGEATEPTKSADAEKRTRTGTAETGETTDAGKGTDTSTGTGTRTATGTDTGTGTGTGTGSKADGADAPADDETEPPVAAHGSGADDGRGADDGGEGPGGRGGGEPARGWRERHPAAARTASVTTTVLALALVLTALLLPNALTRLTPNAFLRIPLEGIFGAIALVTLPPRARNWTALIAGTGLGLVTILKFVDMGFYSVLARPFDLVLDWILFDDAMSFLKDTLGSTGAVLGLIGIIVLALLIVFFMALAVRRLGRLMARRSMATTRTAIALGTVWVVCAVFGAQTGADHVDVASRNNILLLQNRVDAFNAGIKDAKEFKKQARVDRFDGTPADKLMPALRGKNVIFTFIESYGRSAIEDPEIAPGVNSVLDKRTKALDDAGFSSRSGWLTSPISGAGSWMGHSTLMSGLWVANQQRYRSVTSSDRMSLVRAFRKTGDYRMVGIMPGVTRSWPEGKFYGMDHVYDSRELGYKGPKFSWAPVPDQFSLKAFERLEHGKAANKPMMATIILASSHNPWSPLPVMLPWDKLGDGSVYQGIHDRGARPTEVWKDPHRVREQYGKAIQYSVQSLTEYVEKYGDDDTVLVFLGDHQPVPTVTGGRNASKDVPISIVAHDDKVLEKISDWGWDEGLKPSREAPVWRMDKFRDRFMTAYGSEPEPGAQPEPKSDYKSEPGSGGDAGEK